MSRSKATMAALAASNPITGPVAVPLPGDMLQRVRTETAHQPFSAALPRRSGTRLRLLVCGSLAAVLAVFLLTQLLGTSRSRLDVAAAAYAATSPGTGVIESIFETRAQVGGRELVFAQHQWLDASTSQAREQITYSGAGKSQITDRASRPGSQETWSNAAGENVVRRERVRYTPQASWGFAGLQLEGVGGVTFFRRLYREGKMHLVGHVHSDGVELWKLESSSTTVDERPHTRLVALVDPGTFLPSRQTLLDVSDPAHPRTLASSVLVAYRHRPATDAASVFDLRAQYPTAQFVTRAGIFPKFRPLHPKH
jgi:hypothetical protein